MIEHFATVSTKAEPAPDSNGTAPPRARVVVGVDCEPGSGHVLRMAAEIPAGLDADLDAVFAYLAPTHYGWALPIAVPKKTLSGQMHDLLRDVIGDTFGAHHPPRLTLFATEGDPARVLIARAKSASMLVVGSSGHSGLAKLLLGSVAAKCVEHATGPVLVVHPQHDQPEGTSATSTEDSKTRNEAGIMSAGRIVVGVDGSEASKEALRWAGHLADVSGTGIDAVIAWDPAVYFGGLGASYIPTGWNPRTELIQCLGEAIDEVFGDHFPADLRLLAEEGSAAQQLLAHARRASFLVVGNRGHGGFASLLLGSVSARCANQAACPVLVTHAPPHLPDAKGVEKD